MNFLIVYDIPDDKRRRMVEKALSSYGVRVNYSVFEVEASAVKFNALKDVLLQESDSKEDHIRIYVLNKESLKKSFVLHRDTEVFSFEALYL